MSKLLENLCGLESEFIRKCLFSWFKWGLSSALGELWCPDRDFDTDRTRDPVKEVEAEDDTLDGDFTAFEDLRSGEYGGFACFGIALWSFPIGHNLKKNTHTHTHTKERKELWKEISIYSLQGYTKQKQKKRERQTHLGYHFQYDTSNFHSMSEVSCLEH